MSSAFGSVAPLLAIIAGILVFHAVVCLYVLANPQAAASALAQPNRTIFAWILLSSLRVGRADAEMDLVQTSLPYDAIVANCKRRAALSLMGSGAAIVVFAFVFLSRGFAP
jgi:hypothetical protein